MLEENLVDKFWTKELKRPDFPMNEVFLHLIKRSGVCTKNKIADCRKSLKQQNIEAIFLSSLDEVAWVLNLRGSDLQFSPLFFSFFVLTHNSATLFTHKKRINKEVQKYLEENQINLKEYDDVVFGIHKICETEKIRSWLLEKTVSYGFYKEIFSKTAEFAEKETVNFKFDDENTIDSFLIERKNPYVLFKTTPIELAKSKKNEAEIEGMREAHIKDGLALTRFLFWIEQKMESGEFKNETECTFANKLDYFRSQQDEFVSLSFQSISAFGKNGAIIHYRADEKTCLNIEENNIYLFDSGSQYLHGTTDVTRTIYLRKNKSTEPTSFQKSSFTFVLKGHIAIASCIFPENTTGVALDILARANLWKNGLDYRHGTGHGVGAFLNVHEGPHGISPNIHCAAAEVPLATGMIVSNEPGFYSVDNFGIRIENLLLVQPAKLKSCFEETNFYKFEDLTYVPFQTTLIDKSLLTQEEISWVNDYNKRAYDILKKRFEEEQHTKNVNNSDVIAFLTRITAPI